MNAPRFRCAPHSTENHALKIAVVGSGIAGLSAAARLHAAHELTVFEAASYAGGHACTVDVPDEAIRATLSEPAARPVASRASSSRASSRDPGLTASMGRSQPMETASHAADLGFMVWNHHTYPELKRLFESHDIATEPTSMGFSLSDRRTSLEYAGETLDGVFAQRRNLLRPSFVRMLFDIMRFNRHAMRWVAGPHADSTLGDLIQQERFPREFRDHFLVPMGAAIWSASEHDILAFPAAFFVRFLHNHGMLAPPSRQFRWRVVTGGARRYVSALSRPFANRIRLSKAVQRVRRLPGAGVEIVTADGCERFDAVVLALHADQALAVLEDPTMLEREALTAFPYRRNSAVLHTDHSVLPHSRRAWASWNYHVPAEPGAAVGVTYDLSRLQHLRTCTPLLLTLNDGGRVAPGRVLLRTTFDHPAFTQDSVAMQARHAEVSGRDRVHYCGAYWRNGFHEDGLVSGLAVADAILAQPHPSRGTSVSLASALS